MPFRSWTLIDQRHNIYQPQLVLGPRDVGGSAQGYAVNKHVLTAGRSAGVDVVEVDNGTFRFSLLPTRGLGLWKAWLGDLEIGWHSPVRGPVHPAGVPVGQPNGLGFLDGFDELLTRCGLESNGAPEHDQGGVLRYPLHGHIANLPADYLELAIDGETGEIRLTGEVREARFLIKNLRLRSTLTTRVGRPGLSIVDEVCNDAATPTDIQLLYHINFGLPLLGPGARLVAPLETLAPKDAHSAADLPSWDVFAAEEAGFAERVYFAQLSAGSDSRTQVLLKNAAGSQGVSLTYRVDQLPYFILWKNTGAAADGYVTGLEPATNLPNRRSFEAGQGRTVKLAPGQSARFELELTAHSDSAAVANAERAIDALRRGRQPKIYDQPRPGWSMTG